MLVGTGLDYVVHSLSPSFAVPGYYFSNKIIFATLLLAVGVWLFWNVHSAWKKSIVITAWFAVLLQTRYAITRYPLWSVLFFAVVHFVVFLPPVYWALHRNPKLFNVQVQ